MKPLRIIARDSLLSLTQVDELMVHFPAIAYELLMVDSFGDNHKDISLIDNQIEDIFTRELDQMLLSGEADVAIHSAKDLPYPLPVGIEVVCLTRSEDKSDSLISRTGLTLLALPPGARIGTSSSLRRAELLALRPDLEVVSIRGTIPERIALVENGEIDALIVATCAMKRLGIDNCIAETLPFKTNDLQGSLAVTARLGTNFARLFSAQDARKLNGKVTLVGFGSGNPDLLTMGGDKALKKADAIFYDDLTNGEFLKKYSGTKLYVGKRKGNHSYNQNEINELLYQKAESGLNVVRLKGGDPMVFAHGREEIDYLQRRFIEVKVVPGVTAALSLAASTHIPLTHRGVASSVAFITGHSIKTLQVPTADTLVYYMGGYNINQIATRLIEQGRSEDSEIALVYNISHPDQRTFFSTLKELRFSTVKLPTPITIVVGDVVSFESHRQRTLHTGTTLGEYSGSINCRHTPLIKIEKLDSEIKERLMTVAALKEYDWIIFTSQYGVKFFFEELKQKNIDTQTLNQIKIATVGEVTTKTLSTYHFTPTFESHTQSASGILEYFNTKQLRGIRILLPRSNKGLTSLLEGLLKCGYKVTDLPIYSNRQNPEAVKVNLKDFDKIIFNSPSSVEAFINIYGELPSDMMLVAKGETTKIKIENEKI